ncbi:WhiB family transcriptional regulator [Streptomyces drozdowiczii]|uniref:WhiB family transcriptional regulator n=1 Tax=Streptomyces drozdowiczii TaxID=202862 RepID=UPI00403D54CC
MIALPAFLDGTALCAASGTPDLWTSTLPADEAQAAAQCRACPLRAACADHALTVPEDRGTWGGLTARERRRILRPDDPTWVDDDGRLRHPCGEYKALLAHISLGEECDECRAAQDARTRANRLARLKGEHAKGGTVAGARAHRLLQEPVCDRCRAAQARQSVAQRRARGKRTAGLALALAS